MFTSINIISKATAVLSVIGIIKVYEPSNVLLCLWCKTAVPPGKSVETHFRKIHKETGARLANILRFASSRPSLCDPATAELPCDGAIQVEGLHVYHGYSCTECRYLTTNRKNIATHWTRLGHRSINGQTEFTKVLIQTFSSRRYARYWIVQPNISCHMTMAEQVSTGDGIEHNSVMVGAVLKCESEIIRADDERRRIVETPEGVNAKSK